MSDERFTVDGTLIEAWALLLNSVTSTKPSAPAAPPDDPGNPTLNFHSDWWCTNVTHLKHNRSGSPSDPQEYRQRDDALLLGPCLHLL